VTALPRDGTEPWPAGPRAMISTKRGSFSVVHHASALGETELGGDRLEVMVGHELRADLRRAFFAGFCQQNHVAVERRVVALERDHQHQPGDQVVLVVDRAAAVHVAALAHRAERRVRPLRLVDGDDVGVPEDQDRPLLAVALEARDDVGARGILGEDLVRNPLFLEHRLEVVDGLGLIARRAAGVDAQQRLEVLDRFGFRDRLLRAGGGRGGRDQGGDNDP
jgi:hypothetical protein